MEHTFIPEDTGINILIVILLRGDISLLEYFKTTDYYLQNKIFCDETIEDLKSEDERAKELEIFRSCGIDPLEELQNTTYLWVESFILNAEEMDI